MATESVEGPADNSGPGLSHQSYPNLARQWGSAFVVHIDLPHWGVASGWGDITSGRQFPAAQGTFQRRKEVPETGENECLGPEWGRGGPLHYSLWLSFSLRI